MTKKQETVKKGEKLEYTIYNTMEQSGYDIYINETLYKTNVTLPHNSTFEIDTNVFDEGYLTIYAKKAQFQSEKTECIVEFKDADIPSGWTVCYLKIEYSDDYDGGLSIEKRFKIFADKKIENTFDYEYYWESDPTDIETDDGFFDSEKQLNRYTSEEYLYDSPDVKVLYIKDGTQKILSSKIKIPVPCYTELYKQYTHEIKDSNINIKEYDDSYVEISSNDSEYIEVKKGIGSQYIVTPIKPTKIPRRVYFKDSNGIKRAFGDYTINYYGTMNSELHGVLTLGSENKNASKLVLKSGDNYVGFKVTEGNSFSSSLDLESVDVVVMDAAGTTELDRQTIDVENGICEYKRNSNTPSANTGYKLHIEYENIISYEIDLNIE